MTDYCIENDFAAQKEMAERESNVAFSLYTKIADLKAQLAASKERERILRDSLSFYADPCNWDGGYISGKWKPAQAALKAAEEAKC